MVNYWCFFGDSYGSEVGKYEALSTIIWQRWLGINWYGRLLSTRLTNEMSATTAIYATCVHHGVTYTRVHSEAKCIQRDLLSGGERGGGGRERTTFCIG